MTNTRASQIFDPLYGECSFSAPLRALIQQPLVQRLREIRLSNIDSVDMPGVANISRYEHSLGAAYLASQVGFAVKLMLEDHLVLQAACLLHDSAMQAFGHLVEEALEYVGVKVSHEERWRLLASGDGGDIGGMDLQIYVGRQSGLRTWAQRVFGRAAESRLQEIIDAIAGQGKFGPAVCGALDLDNLDNVARAAHHMGLDFDKGLPLRIVRQMSRLADSGVTFEDAAEDGITDWLKLRSRVYEKFMLSQSDFAGKVMLISATIRAHQTGLLKAGDWTLTDREFLERLANSGDKEVCAPVERWLTGELWEISPLVWMRGPCPTYPQILNFSDHISAGLSRPCLAYRIKDKTARSLRVQFTSRGAVDMGAKSDRWLLGVGSPLRKSFSSVDLHRILAAAIQHFGCEVIGSELSAEKDTFSDDLPLFASA